MSNLDSILKSRDITEADKGAHSERYGLSNSHIQMWELGHKEGWHQRIDAFRLWCWRRLLRVPWTARRWNQSILKEINSECSLEGLMLKLKFQYFGHLIWRADSLEKTLMLEKIEDRRGWQRMRWLDGITGSTDRSLNKLKDSKEEKPGMLQSMELHSQTRLSDWTKLKWLVGSQLPEQGLNPGPWQWKHWILTTRPPGNSQILERFNYP